MKERVKLKKNHAPNSYQIINSFQSRARKLFGKNQEIENKEENFVKCIWCQKTFPRRDLLKIHIMRTKESHYYK